MNIDQLLLDIIKDKSKGNFNKDIEEIVVRDNVTKQDVVKHSIEAWFAIKPNETLHNLTKTKLARQTNISVRASLPYYSQVRPKLYLQFLKKNDRDAILSNSDD